jgi:hypothetical protein
MPVSSNARAKQGPAAAKQTKVEQPHKAFSEPKEVVADPHLSKPEKLTALDSLEQDARQLSTAAGEGMAGGEETRLQTVLEAKRDLEAPSPDVAFSVVLRTFEAELQTTLGTDAHALIANAMDAINEARVAIARRAETKAPPRGAPVPGSEQELDEELAKEQLDP